MDWFLYHNGLRLERVNIKSEILWRFIDDKEIRQYLNTSSALTLETLE